MIYFHFIVAIVGFFSSLPQSADDSTPVRPHYTPPPPPLPPPPIPLKLWDSIPTGLIHLRDYWDKPPTDLIVRPFCLDDYPFDFPVLAPSPESRTPDHGTFFTYPSELPLDASLYSNHASSADPGDAFFRLYNNLGGTHSDIYLVYEAIANWIFGVCILVIVASTDLSAANRRLASSGGVDAAAPECSSQDFNDEVSSTVISASTTISSLPPSPTSTSLTDFIAPPISSTTVCDADWSSEPEPVSVTDTVSARPSCLLVPAPLCLVSGGSTPAGSDVRSARLDFLDNHLRALSPQVIVAAAGPEAEKSKGDEPSDVHKDAVSRLFSAFVIVRLAHLANLS